MKANFEIHRVQSEILQTLLFNQQARFSELNKNKIPTDQFNFHLKALVESELIAKSSIGKYQLTTRGKEFANRFDTDKSEIEKQGKICVSVYGIKLNGKNKKYLLQERLKEPFYGCYGAITGKVRWGEKMEEAAVREFKEETGLDSKVELIYLRHKMDYSKEGDLLDDKVFFVFKAQVIGGELIERFEGGRNTWLTVPEIKKLPKVYDGFDRTMNILNQKEFKFFENKFIVSNF